MQTRIAFATRWRMKLFLVASLCLHAVVALPWMPVIEFAGSRDTVLTVSLDAPRADERPRQASIPAVKKERRKIMTAPATDSVATAPEQATNDTPAQNAPTPDTQAHETPSQAVQLQVQAQLLADLQRYFEYPLLARRRGWQGTVWLGFTLESDGALERIHVARSSGYDVLDDSAIAALKRVGRLSQAKHRLNGLAFEMNIPVVYRLKDN